MIGNEERGKGAAVNLGPTVNLDRDPRWGRSFEAFSEDPFLSGSLATAEIDGVQSQGELSQIKHYDDYDQETNRNTPQDNEIIGQRPLHELYLASFETAIARAHAASVMCSYATINGNPECQDNVLENGTLKQDWGFPGFITSDYGALHSTHGIVDGTDQEQPEDTYYGAALLSRGAVRPDPARRREHVDRARADDDVPLQPVQRSADGNDERHGDHAGARRDRDEGRRDGRHAAQER